ncbi:arabinosyltransferase [Neisseria meningitidis]|uniref:arabinosyltransferase n=1 Tax=Neisseria meningitidis TaxID=487 RepID=UPI000B6260CA|nr:arabinosyltransferase [Neisseria meningitidis]OUC34109.1 arabinosyltransferase [Neisseria meningitidis]
MFTTNDLRHFLEGLAILFSIGYWDTMLLLLWFLVRFAYKKPRQNPFRQPDRRRYPDAVCLDYSQTILPEQRRNTGKRRVGQKIQRSRSRV